eukprot:gene27311-34007_t
MTYSSGTKYDCRFSCLVISIPMQSGTETDHSNVHIESNKAVGLDTESYGNISSGINTEQHTAHSKASNNATFGPSYELRIPDGPTHQKNWVAFEHHSKLLFVETINPMHVVQLLPFSANNTTQHSEQGVSEESLRGRIQTLHRSDHVDLPWKAAYGASLRGGTNAILIKHIHLTKDSDSMTSSSAHTTNITARTRKLTNSTNAGDEHVYISLFHTKTRAQKPFNSLDTYFMGAMLLCNRPPFSIHAMTEYPLVPREWLYQTAWVNRNMDYVVYPTGILLSSADSNHLLVSFGHQDRDGHIVVFDINKLIDSMVFVSACV